MPFFFIFRLKFYFFTYSCVQKPDVLTHLPPLLRLKRLFRQQSIGSSFSFLLLYSKCAAKVQKKFYICKKKRFFLIWLTAMLVACFFLLSGEKQKPIWKTCRRRSRCWPHRLSDRNVWKQAESDSSHNNPFLLSAAQNIRVGRNAHTGAARPGYSQKSSVSHPPQPQNWLPLCSGQREHTELGFVVTNSSQSHLIMFLQKIQCSLHD